MCTIAFDFFLNNSGNLINTNLEHS